MKVYVVLSGGTYEELELEKIFSTTGLAQEYIATHEDGWRMGWSEEEVLESLP